MQERVFLFIFPRTSAVGSARQQYMLLNAGSLGLSRCTELPYTSSFFLLLLLLLFQALPVTGLAHLADRLAMSWENETRQREKSTLGTGIGNFRVGGFQQAHSCCRTGRRNRHCQFLQPEELSGIVYIHY